MHYGCTRASPRYLVKAIGCLGRRRETCQLGYRLRQVLRTRQRQPIQKPSQNIGHRGAGAPYLDQAGHEPAPPLKNDHCHSQAAPGSSGRNAPASSASIHQTRTTTPTNQMKITIPTDQQLGHRIESIVRTIAVIIAFVYAAGFTFGQAIHWLSANLTTLHHLLLHDKHSQKPHPPAHSNHCIRSSNYRTRPSKSTAKGFA